MGKKKKQLTKKQNKARQRSFYKIISFLVAKDETITPKPFSFIDYAGGILVFLIAFGVYLHTLTPSIGLHDAGDMVTAAYVLGIPHPTGYPLYCILGKLWVTILPIGNIAYRMNMLSALCASLACMMVYFIVLKVVGGRRQEVVKYHLLHPASHIPAAVSALMLSFATTFWEQAVIAEKYTLNALFATLIIFILLKWQEAMSTEHRAWSMEVKAQSSRLKAQSYLYLFAFTLGLSFTHHMQSIFLIPPAIYLIGTITWQMKIQPKGTKVNYQLPVTSYQLFKMFIFFFLPLLLWLYLPIRAVANPVHNWGDPQTLDRFLQHISGGQYGYYFSYSIKELIIRIFTHITYFFSHQFTLYLVWIGIVGLVFFFRQRRRTFIFLALLVLTDILHSIRYTIINIEDYYIPSFAVFGVFFGYGLVNIMKYLKKYLPPYLLLLLCLLPIIPYNLHLFHNNQNQHFFAYDYKTNILKHLKPNAILFTEDDNIGFTLWYLCYCEKERQDIDLLSTIFIQYDWYAKQIKHLHPDYPKPLPQARSGEIVTRIKLNNIIYNNIKSRPIYVFSDRWVDKKYGLVPEGMCWRVLDGQVDNKRLYSELEKNKIEFKIRGLEKSIYKDWRTKAIINNYANSYSTYGGIYGNIGKYDKAIIELKKAIKLDSESSNAHYNLGIAYKITGKFSEAIEEFNKAIELDPNNVSAKQSLQSINRPPNK
ncbi:MAG: DUF2723 domain-containing protein [bacterium]